MIFNGLELESRGLVLAIASSAQSIANALLTFVNGKLNSMYKLPETVVDIQNKKFIHPTNYIKGTKLVMYIGYSMMACYILGIVCYKIILVIRSRRN